MSDFELIENLPFTTQMEIGSRARIGLIVLASDYTVENEYRQVFTQPGMDVFHARIANAPNITPETLAAMGKNIPLGRVGTADEVAQAILLCMTNPYMTGTTIDVDGGTLLP